MLCKHCHKGIERFCAAIPYRHISGNVFCNPGDVDNFNRAEPEE